MGTYIGSKEDQDAYIWCIRNNILISALAKTGAMWYIDIKINGSEARDPIPYGKTVIWEKIFKYYRYYYDKSKKKK